MNEKEAMDSGPSQAADLRQEAERRLRNEKAAPVEGMAISPLTDAHGNIVGASTIARDITERKQTETRLRNREAELTTILRTAMDGFSVMDAEGRFLDVNEAYCELIGYSREELLRMAVRDVDADETPEETATTYERVRRLGSIRFERRNRRKDGRLIHVEVSANTLPGPSERFIGFVRDITERKQAELELRESEERFRSLTESAPEAVFVTSADRFAYVNPTACSLFGASRPEDLVGKGVMERVAPEYHDAIRERIRFQRATGKPSPLMELEYLRLDGSRVQVETTSVSIRYQGEDAHVVFARDITERKQAEEHIKLLKHSIDMYSDGAYWFDSDNRLVYVNDAGCQAIGYQREELLGRSVGEINPRATEKSLREVWEQLRRKGQFTVESVHRRKDGTEFPVEISATYVQFGGKEYNCGFARDITERKRAEEDRKAHVRFLESMEQVDRLIKDAPDAEQMLRNVTKGVFSLFDCDRSWLLYRMGRVEKPTVFVVEDEPEARDSRAALISSMGLAVETFGSGEEFLQGVNAGRSGCAVVDFRSGGMDGIELHRRLVEAGCKLPVVLISACLTVRSAVGAMEQGVFRVVEKPDHNDELASAVKDAIEHDRAHRKQKFYRLDLEHRLESLDSRERRTLGLILAGHPNKAIERRLGLSRRTVERARSSILAKTNFLSFVELSAAYGEAKAAGGKDAHSAAREARGSVSSVPVSTLSAKMPQDHRVQDETNWRLLCCDLHDGAAQYVSAALLRLQAIEAQDELPAEARPHLCMAGALLDVALRDIRDIIVGRSPACFMQPGIIPSINRLVQELAEGSGIEFEFVENLGRKKLSPLLETAVCRILQECLNNAIRHSGSDRVRVEIARTPGALLLEVRDWGGGFVPDAVTMEHRGLRGIRERAELLGGRASINSKSGGGTIVTVEIPLKAS